MSKRPPSPGLTRKQQSRIAREARLQRIILITTAIVAASVIGLVGYGLINQYYVIPHTAIARVNGDDILVPQFQDRYLWGWVSYYITGQQPPPDLAQQTLDAMIQEQLVLQEAERLEIDVDEEAVEQRVRAYIEYLMFSNPSYSFYSSATEEDLGTPTPRPTSTPTATYVYTLTPTATRTPDPVVTPTATLPPTATPAGTPTPTATSGPMPTPTTRPEEEYQTGYEQYLVGVSQTAGLSTARVEEFLSESMRMQLLQAEVADALDFDVPQTEIQAHAAHILVSEEDVELADELLERIRQGESFEELAAEYSIDSSNAYRGGDLGWFAPGSMVQEFEAIVFSMSVGSVEGPVHTEFGWHLIKLYDRVEVPLSEYRIDQERQQAFLDYVSTLQDEGDIWISEDWMSWVPALPVIPTEEVPAQP
jgi:parvulin-like peptidyl-prolyl isomerase